MAAKRKVTRKIEVSKVDLIVRSISEFYPNDPTSAGIAIAYLRSKQCFYGSIRRFRGQYGEDPYIVYKTYQSSVSNVLEDLLIFWKSQIVVEQSATEHLRKML